MYFGLEFTTDTSMNTLNLTLIRVDKEQRVSDNSNYFTYGSAKRLDQKLNKKYIVGTSIITVIILITG